MSIHQKSFMMCLSKSMNAVAELTKKQNHDISKKEFYIYLEPCQLGLFGRWITMVVKVDLTTQTVVPNIVTATSAEVMKNKLQALASENINAKIVKADNATIWGNILADYSLLTNDRISNHITNTKQISPTNVLAGIVKTNLTTLLSYANSVKWNKSVLSYGFKNHGHGMTQDGSKYEFANGVNLILTKPVVNNNKLVDVVFSIELSLEILRANKNDKLF